MRCDAATSVTHRTDSDKVLTVTPSVHRTEHMLKIESSWAFFGINAISRVHYNIRRTTRRADAPHLVAEASLTLEHLISVVLGYEGGRSDPRKDASPCRRERCSAHNESCLPGL